MGRKERLAASIVIGAALAVVPVQVLAADLRSGSTVAVGAGETINDDLYAAGGTVAVNGKVNGSVIVAGGTVTIAGTVAHDVMVAGGNLSISGHVNGSVRAAGGNVTITGPVGEDVVVAGGTINVASGATIGRDLVLAGGDATVGAPIARNVTMGSGTLTLRNQVGGDVTGRVDHLVLDGAKIGGNLDYTSPNVVVLTNGASVAGTTTRHPVSSNGAANGFIEWVRALIGIVALGLIFLFVLPRFSTRSIDTLRAEPWTSLGIGAAVLIATPVVAFAIFLIGLLIGGWWIGTLMIPAWLLVLATGYVVSAFLLGRLLFAQVGWGSYADALALIAGLFVLAIVTVIPIIGWLIGLAAVVFGAGALALTAGRWRERMRPAA